MQINKRSVAPGEEVTLTITAQYYTLSPALLFMDAGANAFRLKLLLPTDFVQTGGTYADYIGTELSTANPTATYTLKGYFEGATSNPEFRLLRGSALADASSLFVEKARLSIPIQSATLSQKSAREAAGCSYAQGQYLFTTS